MEQNDYTFDEIIDIERVQRLMDRFYAATNIPVGIISADGKRIHIATGWQPVCTRFHRTHPKTKLRCKESDRFIQKRLQEGVYIEYKCKNGLWDLATPIVIEDHHIATLFLGQFFYKDELPDDNYFISQADEFGFDIDDYLTALHQVPRFTRQKVKAIMEYYTEFVSLLADIGLGKIRQIESERKKANAALQERDFKYKTIFDALNEGIVMHGADGQILACNKAAETIMGLSEDQMKGRTPRDSRWKVIHEDGTAFDAEELPPMISLRTTKPVVNAKLGIHKPSGELSWLKVNTRPLFREHDSQFQGVVVSFVDISELMEIENKLRASKERLLLALKGANDGLWDWNVKTNEVYFSPRWKRMLGYEDHEISHQFSEWQRLICPEDEEKVWIVLNDYFSHKSDQFSVEFRMRHKDGSYRHILSRAFARFDDSGEPVRLIGTHVDITERKRTEEALKKNESHLRALIRALPDLIWAKDQDGVYLSCNPKFECFFGAREVDIIGKTDYDFVNKELADFFRESDKAAIAAGGPEINEEEIIYADDGHCEIIETIKTPIIDDNGRAVGVMGVARDITERKKMEAALRESETKFSSIFEFTPIGILQSAATDFKIIRANIIFSEMIGYSHEELKNMTFADFSHPDDLNEDKAQLQKLIKGDIPYFEREKRYLHKDGRLVWGMIRVVILRNPDGKPNSYLAILLDFTERKQMEEDLRIAKEVAEDARKAAETANRAKTVFLATMSHEIRTPLNAVLGFTELLEQLVTGAREKSYLEAIQTGSKNLLRLINDILDLAKIESGKIALEYESVRLKKLLEDVMQIFSLKIKEKDLSFLFEAEDSLPEFLIMDEVRLRQILFNLIGNAIKFTDKGYIKLTAGVVSKTEDEKYIDLSLTVEDTGIGIPTDEQERIFQAFEKYQHKDGMRKFEGTGLGLAISKRLTEIMGGKMTLTSEVAKGSVFTLILPKIEIASSADIFRQEVEKTLIDVSKLQGTILIVDDVESNRQLVKETFNGTNIAVIEAINGRDALEKINEKRPDLILMDLVMPVMNGIEACKAIKADPVLKSLPVVAITASSGQTQEELHFFDGYLRKPVSFNELIAELGRHLEFSNLTGQHSLPECSGEAEEEIADPDQVLSILEDTFSPRWEFFRERQPLKEVAQFGRDIYDLGETHHSKMLMNFGQSIQAHIERFDIENMRNTLWTFPDLIKGLEKHSEKQRTN